MATNLLVLDDSPLIHRVVELTFDGQDYSIHTTDDADEALSIAQSEKPDIILASADPKNASGIDFCRRLRQEPSLAETPLLVLTSAGRILADDEANEIRAAGVLPKPFEPERLLAEVNRAISSGGAVPTFEGGAESITETDEMALDELSAPEDEAMLLGEEEAAEEPAALPAESPQEQGEGLLEAGDLLEDLESLELSASEAAPQAEDTPQEEGADPTGGASELVVAPAEPDAAEKEVDLFEGSDLEDLFGEELAQEIASEGDKPSDADDTGPGIQPEAEQAAKDDTELDLLSDLEEAAGSGAEPELLVDAEEAAKDDTELDLLADLEEAAGSGAEPELLMDAEEAALEEAPAQPEQEEAPASLEEETPLDTLDTSELDLDDALDFDEEPTPTPETEDAEEMTLDGADEFEEMEELSLESLEDEESLGIPLEEPAEAAPEEDGGTSLADLAAEAGYTDSPEAAPQAASREINLDSTLVDDLGLDMEFEAVAGGPGPGEAPSEPFDIDELQETGYTLPSEEPAEVAGGADEEKPAAPAEAVPVAAQPEPAKDDPGEVPPDKDLKSAVESNLEKTVEAIVPNLLHHIENIVVDQLPDLVEKVVLREIEKIKRGE